MVFRLALLAVLGALSACERTPQVADTRPPPVQAKPAPAPLSKQQADALAGDCEKASLVQFRREWKDGAEMASHYNVKLRTCFYQVTIASSGTLRKLLIDASGGEVYGEFLGPATVESPAAGLPKACRMESFYCASAREWDVLVEPYMDD